MNYTDKYGQERLPKALTLIEASTEQVMAELKARQAATVTLLKSKDARIASLVSQLAYAKRISEDADDDATSYAKLANERFNTIAAQQVELASYAKLANERFHTIAAQQVELDRLTVDHLNDEEDMEAMTSEILTLSNKLEDVTGALKMASHHADQWAEKSRVAAARIATNDEAFVNLSLQLSAVESNCDYYRTRNTELWDRLHDAEDKVVRLENELELGF